MAAREKFNKFRADVTKRLHEPSPVNDVLGKVEQKTGVDRFFIIGGICLIFGLYMVFGYFAELVCNSIGFLYPAYMSVKAIESSDKRDDTQWLTYWVVFAVFSVVEFFADCIVGWFPLYWLAKCMVMLYLHLPQFRGAEAFYQKWIRPFVLKHQGFIDRKLDQARDLKDKVAAEAKSISGDFHKGE